MSSALHIDPGDPTPIWNQIEESLRRLVAAGVLKPGASVPSVRELARDLNINPATVAKAYQHLTDAGVFTVRRGNGTYVADSPPAMSRAERTRILKAAAARFASLAATLGANEREAAEALAAEWKKGARS